MSTTRTTTTRARQVAHLADVQAAATTRFAMSVASDMAYAAGRALAPSIAEQWGSAGGTAEPDGHGLTPRQWDAAALVNLAAVLNSYTGDDADAEPTTRAAVLAIASEQVAALRPYGPMVALLADALAYLARTAGARVVASSEPTYRPSPSHIVAAGRVFRGYGLATWADAASGRTTHAAPYVVTHADDAEPEQDDAPEPERASLSAACGAWVGPYVLTHAQCDGCGCGCHGAPDDAATEPERLAAALRGGLTCAWCVDTPVTGGPDATCHVRLTRGEQRGWIYPACDGHAAKLTAGIAWGERVN